MADKDNVVPISDNPRANQAFRTLAEELLTRTYYAEKLGLSYWSRTSGQPKRDIYKALGYELTPNFQSYYSRYKRQDVASRVVDSLPNATWRKLPRITEDKDDSSETVFEKAFKQLVKDRKIWHYLARADRISGIYQYGVLLLGVDDNKELSEPLDKAKSLMYLRPYHQNSLSIQNWEEDTKNPRFGLPLIYDVKMSRPGAGSTNVSKKVHYSRLIHIAENCLEDDILGTPRMEKVLNRLQDLELIAGGSAEMFWRGAYPGLAFKADPKATTGIAQSLSDLETEIQAYLHDMQRFLRLVNIDVDQLAPQVADPTGHADLLLTLIAAATGIPKRILLGSERGELASSQDEKNWMDRVDERRANYAETDIIRPFIDRLIMVGILPDVKEYTVEWPDLMIQSDKDKAELAERYSKALAQYAAAPGADILVPPRVFLKKYFDFTDEELNQIEGEMENESGAEEHIPSQEEQVMQEQQLGQEEI